VIAVLVVPDSMPQEVAVVQQIFTADHPYEVTLRGEHNLAAVRTADTVLIPGVQDPLTTRSDHLLATLRAAHRAGARMAAFCGGAFLLGQAGILDGRRATTHWAFGQQFRDRFPLAHLEIGQAVVDDGPVHTSSGILSTADLALHLLALDMGHAYAAKVARCLVTGPRARPHDPLGPFLTWLRDHLHEPLTLARVAGHAHVSERSLVRKFREATGMSVLAWINQERVTQARALLETTDHRVADIAAMVGFGSAETLRRQFDRHVGATASAYRAKFR
jgi:transcriptional regulator GlxA family with amidase domain